MQTLISVCVRFNISPARVIYLAYDYSEVRCHHKQKQKDFLTWLEKDEEGNFTMVYLPPFIQDFCLDVLTGRTKVPPKQIGGKL